MNNCSAIFKSNEEWHWILGKGGLGFGGDGRGGGVGGSGVAKGGTGECALVGGGDRVCLFDRLSVPQCVADGDGSVD